MRANKLFSRGSVFEVRLDKAGAYYVVELAGNGEPSNVSEAYASRSNAKRAAIRRALQTENGRWRYQGEKASRPE